MKEGEGDKTKALDTAVKNLVNFIEKGGIVDFVIPEPEEGEEENHNNEQLRVSFKEIRLLEKRIALIEHKKRKRASNRGAGHRM